MDALKTYETTLKNGNIHIYLVNSCYDRCAHCYINAVPETSPKTKSIDTEDLLHFIDLMQQDKSVGLNIGLSGGDPLLHPEITTILDSISNHSQIEVLTSGFALSKRNKNNRQELLEALVKNNVNCIVASPDEPYHSITWDDVADIRKYIKKQGFNPNRLGYPSKKKQTMQKVLLGTTIIGGVMLAIDYLQKKICGENKPTIIPLGRGKTLPIEQQKTGQKDCKMIERADQIYVNYNGELQYCMYSCHDGFMNISELKEIGTKDETIKYVLNRLSYDKTFQDMNKYNRCYFSKKIRKK
ncbi:MAG: radical SAM protein [Nanoarchaeota archaeon]|nr:radical SAM protein [Nanoarchaeota archaeon]MBU1029701.1 radical SAM protein [Nanoarchaeota archaeon]MBU1849611.1 radical SAM protein [Nanoarchaeota archaeon]